MTIIETSSNEFFRIIPTEHPDLAHCWHGVAVKRVGSHWTDKAKARAILVRKVGCRVIEKNDIAD